MRISHRNPGHSVFRLMNRNFLLDYPAVFRNNRYLIRLKYRVSHIYRHFFHLFSRYSEPKPADSRQRFHQKFLFIGQLMFIYVLCQTPDAVAAHLRPGAVCIVNFHLKVCLLWGTNENQPIRANAKMPVAYLPGNPFRLSYVLRKTIYIHVIISQSMHLCKIHIFTFPLQR